MKKIPAPLTACIWVWLIFFFFPWSFFLSFSMELKPMFPFPENWSSHLRDSQWDHSGNISSWRSLLGDFFFLFILSCAWHQLQVLFLFWMERILSSIPKGPFGLLFFFFFPICQKSFWWNILPWPPVWQDSLTCITLSRLKHEKHFENELCWSLGVISCQEIPKAFKPCLQLQSRKPRCYSERNSTGTVNSRQLTAKIQR